MFIAEFLDGPMQDASHQFIGRAKPYIDLYAMPNPGVNTDAPWIIVGYTGLVPEQPWPGQVHYLLDRVVSDMGVRGLYRLLPEETRS